MQSIIRESQRSVGKIPVCILGATGTVGQKMVLLLHNHPWFVVTRLCASEQSAGKRYSEAVRWMQTEPIPAEFRDMIVKTSDPLAKNASNTEKAPIHTDDNNEDSRHAILEQPCRIAFSALDADVAGPIEEAWARIGIAVISNARNHRMRSDVPLVVPEVNAHHLALAEQQPYPAPGCILTNPNCSTIGLVLALKPLQDTFGIEAVQVTTMQAVSGAGYPGVPSLDILDNVVPFISGEEEKLEQEVIKILGALQPAGDVTQGLNIPPHIVPAPLLVSASCHRVPVLDGHMESVSVKLASNTDSLAIKNAWEDFSREQYKSGLPLQRVPLRYLEEKNRPQPRLDRDAGSGMTVSLGRLRPCPVLGWKFEVLVHNTIRGAAGGAVLLGELYAKCSGMIHNNLISSDS